MIGIPNFMLWVFYHKKKFFLKEYILGRYQKRSDKRREREREKELSKNKVSVWHTENTQ